MSDVPSMTRLINAIRPWLGDLVIIGGWAHQLHRLHPLARVPRYEALRTTDADLAFSVRAKLEGNIGMALKAAGFQEELSGENDPPIAQYRLGEEDQGFYVEFLVPLLGSEHKRDGTPDVTLGKAGITAQKLRHLDLLLVEPWTVQLDAASSVPLSTPADVRLANPVSFIAQKLLIQKCRTPEKQAQDVLYIHDTLELFGGKLELLGEVWRGTIRPHLSKSAVVSVVEASHDGFAAVTDVIRSAARLPQDRTLQPELVRRLCEVGLEEVLGIQ